MGRVWLVLSALLSWRRKGGENGGQERSTFLVDWKHQGMGWGGGKVERTEQAESSVSIAIANVCDAEVSSTTMCMCMKQ